MKRLLLALLVAAVGVIGLTYGSAAAHHPVITGSASCADGDGNYRVAWVVRPDTVRGLTWTIDTVTIPDSQQFNYVTTHNLAGPAPSLTKSATWSNGVNGTASGSTSKPGLCEQPTTTTTEAPVTTEVTTGAPVITEPPVEQPPVVVPPVDETTTTTTVWTFTDIAVGTPGPDLEVVPPPADKCVQWPDGSWSMRISALPCGPPADADAPPAAPAPAQLPVTGSGSTVLAIVAGWIVAIGGVCAFLAGSRKGDM